MDVKDKIIVVTGAASGLGRALALYLARDGWCVAVCDIDEVGSQETLSKILAVGGKGQCDGVGRESWIDPADRSRVLTGAVLDPGLRQQSVAGKRYQVDAHRCYPRGAGHAD